jgi:hypothetical protein
MQSTVCRQAKHNSLYVDAGGAPALPVGTWVVTCAGQAWLYTHIQIPGGRI